MGVGRDTRGEEACTAPAVCLSSCCVEKSPENMLKHGFETTTQKSGLAAIENRVQAAFSRAVKVPRHGTAHRDGGLVQPLADSAAA